SINWGVGLPTTTGTVAPVAGQPGQFTVSGSFAYTAAGSNALTVTVVRTAAQQSAASDNTAHVQAPARTLTGTNGNAAQGQAFSGTVAPLVDSNTSSTAGDFTASINWGAGLPTTTGTVAAVAGQPGRYTVSGTFTFPSAGSYALTVTVVRT